MSVGLTGPIFIAARDLYTSSAEKQHTLGQVGVDKLGRKFRYVKAGGTSLVVGNVLQESVRDVQFTGLAVATAAAIGATTLSLTNGTTTTTADQFKGGVAVVSESTGIGQQFVIAGNTVAGSGAALTVTLEDGVRVALATTSKVTLKMSPYMDVIVLPTSRSGKTVGGAIYPITNAQYGWIQSGGLGAALSDATVAAVGEGLS
ncbi:MAG: hypothetical protein NUV80_03880, partial [Candidatus Berkelbacteria bacterium]|nr:hypothetical protein [Candidatus Berkelbacteria bacterium]